MDLFKSVRKQNSTSVVYILIPYSENGLKPFLSHCDNPKLTPFDLHTRLAHILILCEGSVWGLIEI